MLEMIAPGSFRQIGCIRMIAPEPFHQMPEYPKPTNPRHTLDFLFWLSLKINELGVDNFRSLQVQQALD